MPRQSGPELASYVHVMASQMDESEGTDAFRFLAT